MKRREGERLMRTRMRILLATFALGSFAMPAWAQNSASPALNDAISGYESASHVSFQGVRDDWSDHHYIYSRPEPGSEAEYQVQQDSRFWLQQIKRNASANVYSFGGDTGWGFEGNKNKKTKPQKSSLKKDWSVSLGAAGATVGAGMYPAKFSFFPVGSPTCTGAGSDYVAFNIQGVNSSTTQASIVAYNNLYATTCTGTNPLIYWAYNTGRRTVTDAVTSSGSTTLTSATANFTAADRGAAVSGTNIASGTTITTVT